MPSNGVRQVRIGYGLVLDAGRSPPECCAGGADGTGVPLVLVQACRSYAPSRAPKEVGVDLATLDSVGGRLEERRRPRKSGLAQESGYGGQNQDGKEPPEDS